MSTLPLISSKNVSIWDDEGLQNEEGGEEGRGWKWNESDGVKKYGTGGTKYMGSNPKETCFQKAVESKIPVGTSSINDEMQDAPLQYKNLL